MKDFVIVQFLLFIFYLISNSMPVLRVISIKRYKKFRYEFLYGMVKCIRCKVFIRLQGPGENFLQICFIRIGHEFPRIRRAYAYVIRLHGEDPVRFDSVLLHESLKSITTVGI